MKRRLASFVGLQAPRVALVGLGDSARPGTVPDSPRNCSSWRAGPWRTRPCSSRAGLVIVSPPRGVIYDRTGEILVRNVPAYNVTITPGNPPR